MKKVLLVLAVLGSYVSYAQEFMGVKVGGKKIDVINQFKSKGFTVTKDDNSNVSALKGTVAGKVYEVVVVSTPITRTVWKISTFLPEASDWYSLKRSYEDYLKVLSDKYGQPESHYNFFSSPYDEGDGYEMTGVAVGKCNYAAYWSDKTGISIDITKWKQVRISYENEVNSALDEKEKSSMNTKIF